MRSLLVVICIAAGCSDTPVQQPFEMPPVPVQMAAVEVRDVPLRFEAMGVIKPSKMAEVRPQISGIIKKIHFTEGQWVEEGDLLYSIDEVPYAIHVQEVQAQYDQNLVHLNHARKKLQRYESLAKPDLIAEVEWDALKEQIALYEEQVLADEARLAAAKLDLERCKITAPIAGLTGKSALGVGNMVKETPLVVLAQNDPLCVDFMITEKELEQVGRKNPKIKVFLPGEEECASEGKLSFMDHTIDPKSGMLAASGTLFKAHKLLWPGQSVRVSVLFDKKEQAKVIPMRSIKTNQDGPYVFVVKEDQTVEIRPVKLGPEDKGQVVVEEGIEGADRVVIEGHLRLFPGSKIKDIQ